MLQPFVSFMRKFLLVPEADIEKEVVLRNTTRSFQKEQPPRFSLIDICKAIKNTLHISVMQ